MKAKREFLCSMCGVTLDLDVQFTPEIVLCPRCQGKEQIKPKPKRDVILERPEEEPGYGHGV